MTDLPIMTFDSAAALRAWLSEHHGSSAGIWLRIFKKRAAVPSVAFDEVLDEGLCFGWSESARRAYDGQSFLQRFTPRRTQATQSPRNRKRARALIEAGRMTPAGRRALGLPPADERPEGR